MLKTKSHHSTLAGLVDSDEEDQLLREMPIEETSLENMAPVKKGRGRPKAAPPAPAASKVTKIKPASRRLSGRASGKAKEAAAKKGRRTALADKTNLQPASDTEEVDEFAQDELMEGTGPEGTDLPTNKSKPKAPSKKATTVKTEPSRAGAAKKNLEVEAPVGSQPAPQAVKRGRPAKKVAPVKPPTEETIPETQEVEDEMDVDGDEDEEIEETIVQTALSAPLRQTGSRQRQPVVRRRHAGSGSDTERTDPALRRKLGEMTKNFEALSARHRDLREIGVKEAERNFEKLKKQSDENSRISNELIKSLKAEVAQQTSQAKESNALKKKLETRTTEIAALEAQVTQLRASLTESQTVNKTLARENKTLEAQSKIITAENKTLTTENAALVAGNKTLTTKLAATRTAAASVESVHGKIPGSAAKTNGGIRMIGTAEAAQLAQAAQLKEDIYSDLTGLIIQSVKRESDEDVFNCLQTSRNGTLHFKLGIANEKAAESYDDAACSYVPQLDPSRDQVLVQLLPDYLVDEITFPRDQAAGFYARVVKALSEKPS